MKNALLFLLLLLAGCGTSVRKTKDLKTGKVDLIIVYHGLSGIDSSGFWYGITEAQADSIIEKYKK